jgi:AraC-like DNA-binding protein
MASRVDCQIRLLIVRAFERNSLANEWDPQGSHGASEFVSQAGAAESGLVVFESRQAPGYSDQPKDPLSRFYLVIAGHPSCECGGRQYVLGPDTICHVPAGLPHRKEVRPKDAVLTYVIHYRPGLLSARLNAQLTGLGIAKLDLGSTIVNQARMVRSIFQEMLFEQKYRQEGWEVILQSRLMDLVVRVLRLLCRRGRKDFPAFEPGSDSTDRVARYALQLKSQFFRQESIADVARSVGLGSRQFGELFRKITGQSWRQYVLGLRLKHAEELLSETDRSASAVAFESGFDDLSNFYHCFKAAHNCAPLAYREQRRVRLPVKMVTVFEASRTSQSSPGFRFRGMKGWSWTTDQYLEEIPTLAGLKMNFLMNCYRSMSVSQPGEPWCNKWWRPMTEPKKQAFARIIRACRENGITFCFALHPQLASPRPLNPASMEDREKFFQHYVWAQGQGVKWFSVCLDDTSWGPCGPETCGRTHAELVNRIFERLQSDDSDAQMICCPAAFWGDGTNPEHHAYLTALGRDLHQDVYVFWNGDAIVTPRITRVAAESYRRAVQHRLFLWDNYPVNDGSPTLHLGPLGGREADLCEVIEGYLSNPMCAQNQINRIPLATSADYAYNPKAYNPARSIGQAILRLGKTLAEQQVLKDLVDAYPGFIVAGGGTGTNPVRARFGNLHAEPGPDSAACKFIRQIEDIASRLAKLFPSQFPATRQIVLSDVQWMKQQLGRK